MTRLLAERGYTPDRAPVSGALLVAGDVRLVLGQGEGELVRAVVLHVVAHVVLVVRLLRAGRRLEGGRPGAGDGAGRESGIGVGVEGVLGLDRAHLLAQ